MSTSSWPNSFASEWGTVCSGGGGGGGLDQLLHCTLVCMERISIVHVHVLWIDQ